jgi:putative membrane protein
MAFLTAEDKQNISLAIQEAESKTSGEIVAVIARAADTYRFIPLLWPALIALSLPGILLTITPTAPALDVYAGQIALFIFISLILQIPPVKYALIPKSVKFRRASRLARNQFHEQGLHLTQGRTGVLIFVSVAEHYVEVIADKGIHEKVPPGTWDEIVANFVGQVRAKRTADGFLAAINAVGEKLAENFPGSDKNIDELPNHLIEI